ncbi:toll/interleukin-1 receptor domain-containing protein [Nodosilinea sp. AN01ver1]|uniref:toll/interleukin-1 receptor domain-containing protein n=1 Tax=Nodosilinea sp. AN01ver1 TaxID=3423362 RepID=UPI003D313EE1
MSKRGRIFISYRRADSLSESGRIYDCLSSEFGENYVYKDVHSISAGSDYRKHIKDALKKCDILIVIIGKSWLTVMEADEQTRRLDNPEDWVRLEIETALKRKIVIIPVLVGGASLPKAHELPKSLKDITYLNSVWIREDRDFRNDIDYLVESIKDHFSKRNLAVGNSQKTERNQNTEVVQVAFRLPRIKKKSDISQGDRIACFVFTVLAFAFPAVASNIVSAMFGCVFLAMIAVTCIYRLEK